MSAGSDVTRLERLLGGPETAWLLDRVVRRLEGGRPLHGTVTLAGATAAQRTALDRLLGRRPTQGSALSVSLDSLSRMLSDSGVAPDLVTAVETLRGPVRDRVGERAADAASWAGVGAQLDALVELHPQLAAWRDEVRVRGLVRRLAGGSAGVAEELVSGVAACLRELPAADEPRSVFAARVVGDGHGLDDGRPLATLVFGAARHLGRTSDGSGADWRREVWESVGVLTGDLVAPVLTLGLRADRGSLTGRLLTACAESGEPLHLSLRQLTRDPPDFEMHRGRAVFVCENPSVVAVAAERLGRRCSPLVCVSGQPGGAARRLLRLLSDAGAVLRYHGDFDWPGLGIAATIVDRYGAQPWRFDAAAYVEALARANGGPLRGRLVPSPWDPALAEEMRGHQVRIEEEHVLDVLMQGLRLRLP